MIFRLNSLTRCRMCKCTNFEVRATNEGTWTKCLSCGRGGDILEEVKLTPPAPEPLKPCPFCGGEAGLSEQVDDMPRCGKHKNEERVSQWWVYCTNHHECRMIVSAAFESKEEAITAWNHRV